MTDTNIVIALSGVSKKYKLFNSKQERMKEALHPFKKKYHKEFYALNELNLKVARGEILGIVGVNGSGKSTLLKIIAGIIPPTNGSVVVRGNVVPLLELGSGFNPEFTGLENIYFYNSILGYTSKETDAILDKILDFAEIGDFIHQPIKTYSSGMKARLSFAVSVNINPDILIVDEVLSVGDELFRRKSFAKIEEFFKAGKTILFVSHSIQSINQLCSRVIMLHNGQIVLDGIPRIITMNYQKFIFSAADIKNKILNDFKVFGASMAENSDITLPGKVSEDSISDIDTTDHGNEKYQEFLLNNFKPKSTVITKNANISISEFRIENTDNKEVNHLIPGREYFISYKISFLEDVGHISLGVGIKTEKGISTTWRIYPSRNSYLPKSFANGETIVANWRFVCSLNPGLYYIGITIRKSMEGGSVLAFRGSDIHVFKVVGENNVDRGGIYDANLSLFLK